VVQRMVRDLDMPVRIEVLPTVREPDGLALSSRNVRLSRTDRARALGLSRALRAAREAVAAGERDADRIRAAALEELTDVDAEYLAIVDPVSFTELTTIVAPALVAVAARVGPVRLIDNLVVEPVPAPVATG
jgi:pantoate--beta-alanine ligase